MSYTIPKGDTAEPMAIQIFRNDVMFAPDADATVELLWTKPDGTESTVALVEVNRLEGRYRRDWVAGDTDQIGAHRGRVIVTDAQGKERSFPSTTLPLTWYVVKRTPGC